MDTLLGVREPEDVPMAFELAWNAHDMTALQGLFTEDATFVNRFGRYVKGVSEIVAMHAPIHASIYSDSTLKNELIGVDHIGDGVAIVHFWSRLAAGAAHPAGRHEIDTVILTVVSKRGNNWLICALENVTVTDPRTGEPILRGT